MDYKLIRAKRKTIELSIDDELNAVVKAPLKMSTDDINAFVEKHSKWIEKHRAEKKERLELYSVSPEQESMLRKEALSYLTKRMEYFAKLMGLQYTGIKITSAKKRFGSCSGKNSICYSWHLIMYPPEAIDYVVVHELAHIVHKNHGKDFYKLIENYLPDYKNREKLLK